MNNRNKWLTIASITVLFVALFFSFSLLSYNPAMDPPLNTSSSIHNLSGQAGAYLSHYFYLLFGILSWGFVVTFYLLSVDIYSGNFRFFSRSSILGTGITVIGLAGCCSYLDSGSCGLLGMYLQDRFQPFFGSAGSLLIFLFFTITGLRLGAWNLLRGTVGDMINIFSGSTENVLGRMSNVKLLLRDLANSFKQLLPNWNYSGWLSDVPDDKNERSPATVGASGSTNSSPQEQEVSTSNNTPSNDDSKTESSPQKDSDEQTGSENGTENDSVLPFDKGTSDNSPEQPKNNDSSEKEAVEVEEDRPSVDEADLSHYKFPSLNLLSKGSIDEAVPDEEDLKERSKLLEDTFEEFGLQGEVVGVRPGPVLTMFEVEPGPGVPVSKFQKYSEDIKLKLAVESVRIVSPIPGKSALGIEVPNSDRAIVKLRDLLETSEFQSEERNLPLALGMDVHGETIVDDLSSMPHLLVAGATGSGKSVGLNAIISSLLFKLRPDHLKFIMIDPKRVEFSLYKGLPHLMTPVIDDSSEATKIFKWAVREMENRYEKLSENGVKDLRSYNEQVSDDNKMPYLVIIVDEMADLMMSNPKECEKAIVKLAQKARATGIHMVLATQRPDKDVITGLIKANMPARISFRVINKTNSRIILDQNGAETLMGNGDLLYMAKGNQPKRAQGSFVTAEETKAIVKSVKEQLKPSYVDKEDLFGSSSGGNFQETMDDEHYDDAKKLVVEKQKASSSMIQRRFRVGYNRAARMIDAMEEEGIVGPHRGSKARNVLVDQSEYFDEDQSNGE